MPTKRTRKRRPLAQREKAEITYLNRERAMEAAAKAEILFASGDAEFPSVIETLWKMFNDNGVLTTEFFDKKGNLSGTTEKERVSTKDRIAIAKALGSFVGFKERVLAEAGLGKQSKKVVNKTTNTQINISAEDWDRIPADVREKMIEARLESVTSAS